MNKWEHQERPEIKPSGKGRKARAIHRKFKEDYGIPDKYRFDHVQYNGEELISEPYSIGMDALKELINKCEEEKLSFDITGRSYWYPGETLRIVFTEDRNSSRTQIPRESAKKC